MNIAYLITTLGHGKGGHFYSLNTIANELGKTHNVNIINIGSNPSTVLKGSYVKYNFISCKGYDFIKIYRQIKELTEKLNIDIFHAFDVESFAFSRLLSKFYHQSNFLNKCGGPNPSKYFPIADNQIVFSKENFNYFINKGKSQVVKIIPNRVKKIKINSMRIKKFYEKYGLIKEIKILRISRISDHYKETIIQCINLSQYLKSKGIKNKFILIGAIQSKSIFNEINIYIRNNNMEENVIIESDEDFTNNASELLDIGDLIIGTGRNFMEASSIDKALLVPYFNSKYPCLVNDDNFSSFFSTNFSPRSRIPNYNVNRNLESITSMIENNESISSKSWFADNFDIERAAVLYEQAYIQKNRKIYYIDIFINILYSIRSLFKSYLLK